MNTNLIMLNLISLTFAIGAILLAMMGVGGWGWMIFASIITYTWVESKEE